MFQPVFGTNTSADDMKGSTLVIASMGVGLSPQIGCDLYILNCTDIKRLGFYKSEKISPAIANDLLTVEG